MIGQFSLYQFKGMSGTVAPHGVEIVLKKIGHGIGHIVESQEIRVSIMLSCWASSRIGIICTQTIILCKFYL